MDRNKAILRSKLISSLIAAREFLQSPEGREKINSTSAKQIVFFLQMAPVEDPDFEAMEDVLNECIDFMGKI